MNPLRKRFNSIDIAKVVAIILVVVGHYMPVNSPGWWVAIHDMIYTFHMPLFFFASGFLYAATRRDVGYVSFMRRKFMRLMVPYFSASVVIIAFKLLTERGDGSALENPVTPMAFLEMFWSPSAGYFLWFIWALMWMFAVVGAVRSRMGRAVLAVVAVALSYEPWAFTSLFCLEQARVMFVYFMLGAVGADLRDRFPSGAEWWVCAAVVALFIGGEWMFVSGGAIAMAVRPVLPYLGIGATLLLSRRVDRGMPEVRKWLLWLAPYTYFIYLFHTTFEGIVKALLQRVDWFSGAGGAVFAAGAFLAVAVGIAGPVLAWRWFVGRVPLLSAAFGGRQ